MKKGQNTNHEKTYFQTGLGGKFGSWKTWILDQNPHQKAKNIARKKKKRK
ncbi:MAG: hypothetical protein K0R26_1918 [Bacteroidota bacterium]|jgi:hypothetical protein|nr:hypothetical protein [Bacteroidota bacterium]